METTHPNSEVLIPDQVIDDRLNNLLDGDRGAAMQSDEPLTALNRRQKLAATMLFVVLAIAALSVATVVAIGAAVVAVVLFVVGVVARIAQAISGRPSR